MKNFKYTLRTGSKKDHCPACNKKTYTPYLETESGNEIEAGLCDRIQKCGYHKKPESNEPIYAPKNEEVEIKTDYIENETLYKYFERKNTSNFYTWLLTKFSKKEVVQAEYDYLLSSKGAAVIFWQVDQLERVRSGKIMEYNQATGKRSKNIDWIHKQPFNLKQCLFGLHLSKEDRIKPIAIVESEKTAIIMSIKEPSLIWMACGSLNGFKLEYLAPLRLRKILGFPDKGCFDNWNEVAKNLNEKGFDITISDILENNTNANLGDDIADLVI